jgi:hypothetical protein
MHLLSRRAGSSLALLVVLACGVLGCGVLGCTAPASKPSPTPPGPFEAVDAAPDSAWAPLFDGESLDGWTPKVTGHAPGENPAGTFRVEDGMLTVRYDGYDRFDGQFGHLVSDTAFSHYAVRVEYRFAGDQAPGGPGWATENSGVMLHAQPAETMTRDQDFPVSVEVQLLGSAGADRRPTANLCTPGTHVVVADTLTTAHCIESASRTYPGGEWVRAEALVLGDSLAVHRVNGREVLRYTGLQVGGGMVANADPDVKQDGTALSSGRIALQSESHPVQFRTVEVLNLKGCTDPEAVNARRYYRTADPSACRYE